MRMIDDNIDDLELLKAIDLFESLIDESTWNDTNSLEGHFDKHVLKEDEVFDETDPKFDSSMKIDDYKREAEKLSISKAGKHDDKKSDVIGFELRPRKASDAGSSPRYVKIKRNANPKYLPAEALESDTKYKEAVIYVDQPHDDNIISYMLIRLPKFFNFVYNMFADELPENK